MLQQGAVIVRDVLGVLCYAVSETPGCCRRAQNLYVHARMHRMCTDINEARVLDTNLYRAQLDRQVITATVCVEGMVDA